MNVWCGTRAAQHGAARVQSMVVWALIALSIAVAYWSFGWPGVAFAVGGVLMWLLLHFTRLTMVLKRAADAPIGHTDSAVMLNAKLHKGQTLLHVIGLNRALGQLQTAEGQQPEVFRWLDPSDAWVDATFVDGKLQMWQLHRPPNEGEAAAAQPAPVPHTPDATK
jgi:hypothetical protein